MAGSASGTTTVPTGFGSAAGMTGPLTGTGTMGGKGGGTTATPKPAVPATQAAAQAYAPTAAQPVQMTQPGVPNVFNQAAGAYNTALAGPNIGQFMNPYQQQVIGNTMNDIGAAQQSAMNQLGAQASAAGAFGGSRHGVAEAATNANFIKQMADTSANMNMQGWNTALGAAQNQQQMMSNLAQQGFNFGNTLNQQQMQQGALQQAMNQQLIDAAKAQYAGFTGAPQNALALPMAAVGAANMGQQTQTQTQSPGLFNYLSLLMGA